LTGLLNEAIVRADRGDSGASGVLLVSFIVAARLFAGNGILRDYQAATLVTLATVGIQALASNGLSASLTRDKPGTVAAASIASLASAGRLGR
jgi:hypothetical protein